MERNKFLGIAVVLLLVLNLGTLAYLFFTADKKMPLPPPPQGERQPPPFAPMLQKQLQLSDEQTAQVQQIHESHLQKMDSLEKQYRLALQQYFNLLQQNNFQQQKDSLENILSLVTKQRAAEAFHHFYAIKEILNPQQALLYQKQLPQILEPVLHNRKNSPPPPKE